MLSALTPIYGAYRFADTKIAAYIAWKTYCVLLDYDIEDYYELIGDMISDLRFNMRQHPDMFTNEEKLRYAEFIEEYRDLTERKRVRLWIGKSDARNCSSG